MAYLNTISFPLAADRITHYTTGNNAIFACIFDATNNLMVLKVLPGQYTPVIRALSSTDVVEGLGAAFPRTSETRQEATVEIVNGMIVVAQVLNELRQNAIDDGTHQITVYDGCMVEFPDREQGYTIRQWWLELPVVPKAAQARRSVGQSIDERMYAGYTLEFTSFGS